MNSTLRFINLFEEVSPEQFKASYWTQHFLFQRSQPDKYNSLLTIEDLDELLTVRLHDQIELVKQGKLLPREEHQDGQNKQKVFELYHSGYTIILSQLNKYWEPLRNLCLSVPDEIDFLRNVYANVYLTPQQSQGLAKHADLQDVLILQVAGSKRWKLFQQSFNHPTSREQFSKNADQIETGKLIFDETLTPGDLLYIPRGMIHEVFTSEQSSAHITLTLETYTNMDLMMDLLQKQVDESAFMRSTVSAGFHADKQAYLHNILQHLTEALPDFLHKNEVIVDESYPNSNANFRGHFLNLEKLHMIDENSTVTKRQNVDARIIQHGATFEIVCGGEKLEIEEAEAEMLFLKHSTTDFRPADLPGDSDLPSKIELIQALVEIGYLDITEA